MFYFLQLYDDGWDLILAKTLDKFEFMRSLGLTKIELVDLTSDDEDDGVVPSTYEDILHMLNKQDEYNLSRHIINKFG